MASILGILNSTQASALISFVQPPDELYLPIHTALLQACSESASCKRFIPSEWVGNVEGFPMLPTFYGASREPFRQVLKKSEGIEWTLFNGGWLADYFLPSSKTYMPAIPEEFPIDANGFSALIRGTGDEPQSWTCGREIAQAVVRLLKAQHWDPVTYVAGEWNTFNNAVKIMESFYGQSMEVTRKPIEEMKASKARHEADGNGEQLVIAQVEEWMIAGASAVPKNQTLKQRTRFFDGVQFSTLQDLLHTASSRAFL